MPDADTLFLYPVAKLEDIDGEKRAVTNFAIVRLIAADPAAPARVLVRVVDGLGVLRDWTNLTVEAKDLISRAEMDQRLTALRERARGR